MFSTIVDAPVDKSFDSWSTRVWARRFARLSYRFPQYHAGVPVDKALAFPV